MYIPSEKVKTRLHEFAYGQRGAGRGITQPSLHLLAWYCTLLISKFERLQKSQDIGQIQPHKILNQPFDMANDIYGVTTKGVTWKGS